MAKTILTTPHRFRERILGFGDAGCGKTAAGLSIARQMPDSLFFAVDNDVSYSYDRLLSTHFADVEEVGNVNVHTVTDEWEDIIETMKKILRVNGDERDNWLLFDSATPTWQSAQDYFTNRVMGSDLADYFMRQRALFEVGDAKGVKKTRSGPDEVQGFDGWKDWSVINKVYAEFYKLLKRWPGHFYVTAELTKLTNREDKDVSDDFGGYAVKPKGQKRLPYVASTCVWFTKTKSKFFYTTIKDRGRELVEGEEFDDFALDYLMTQAGWKLEKA